LFDLEADIMQVVWSSGWQRFCVADVLRELERHREIAYTTVMTTVGRLHDKGLLRRAKEGKRYLYWPAMTQLEFAESVAERVIGSLSSVDHQQALALLVEQVAEGDAEELDRLEALIQARRKALRS
jgi:predicted transcriptional regulator